MHNSAPDHTGLGSFIEQRKRCFGSATAAPQRSYQVVLTRGAAIGQLGQPHCGHTAGKRSLGSITLSQRSQPVIYWAPVPSLAARLVRSHVADRWPAR